MERRLVESSNIASVGYDVDTRVLEVEFKPNRQGNAPIWQYSPVPQSIVDEMLAEGASVGTVFHSSVRGKQGVTAVQVGLKPAAV